MIVASPASLPVANALSACAEELDALARACEALQHALAPTLVDGSAVEAAQGLDLVTQSLAALSTYLGEVSCQVPAEWVIDAGRAGRELTLADLAGRLQGRAVAAPAVVDAVGDLDLFTGPQ